MTRSKIPVAILCSTALVVLLAGCGSGAAGEPTPNPTSASETQRTLEEARAGVTEGFEGTDTSLPDSAPAPTPGKNVWIISCGSAFPGCAIAADAAEEAAASIGWKTTTFDGQLTPSTYATGISNAIADKADGIILDAVDCQFVQKSLEDARAAGIPIVAMGSFDCDTGGGEPLFDAEPTTAYGNFQQYVEAGTGAIADYVRDQHDDQASVLFVTMDDSLIGTFNVQGVKDGMAGCADCTTYETNINGNDLVTGSVRNKVAAALVQHPDVNTVVAPFDAAVTFGIGQAVAAAGRPILLTGVEGLAPNLIQISDGGPQNVAYGMPLGWFGWGSIDQLNRIFEGSPTVSQGVGYQLIDKDHNIPAASEFYNGNVASDGSPKQDYAAHYRQIWNAK